MNVLAKGIILTFVLSLVDADEVRRIHLPIHWCAGCGGNQLSVRMQTGSRSCYTTAKESFSSGDHLTWSRHQLGDCQGFTINSRTRIGLHTGHTNQYAVQGTMTIHTDSNQYHANIPNAWRGRDDNSKTYGITINESVLRIQSLRMKNGGHRGNIECRGYDISVKLVNGEEECTMERKPEIWEHGVETWTGDQLGECRNFRFDENTIAYILVNSYDELFCPKTIEVKMNDPQQHKFRARIAQSVSRVGRLLGGFNRDTNTRQINGFRQIWPLENRGPQERIPDVTCPSENDPNACPSEFMTAYETSSHQSMNCAFTCSAIKRIPSSADFNAYNGTGLQCFAVDYLSPQFNWCCKTKRVHATIPKCSDVGVRDSEWGTTTNIDINQYSSTNEVHDTHSSSDVVISTEATCPENGCPVEYVEEIVDRNGVENYWTCDVTDGCDYVRSEDTSDPNSGISCQRTRRQRRPSKFCCNMNREYDGTLPRCSDLRAEMRMQRMAIASENLPQPTPDHRSHRSHTHGMNFTVEGRDYHVVMERKTNAEAKDHCRHEVFRGRSGKLFEPKDRSSYLEVIRHVERIVGNFGRRMWMGIERSPVSPSHFRYMTDAESLVDGIADWGQDQPDNFGDNEDCVEYWTSKAWKEDAQLSKQWNDINCSHRRTAICEAVLHDP